MSDQIDDRRAAERGWESDRQPLSLTARGASTGPAYLRLDGPIPFCSTLPVARELETGALGEKSNLVEVAPTEHGRARDKLRGVKPTPQHGSCQSDPISVQAVGGPLGLWNRTELAEALGVSTRTIDRRRHEVGFPVAMTLLGRPRWRVADVREWLERRVSSYAW